MNIKYFEISYNLNSSQLNFGHCWVKCTNPSIRNWKRKCEPKERHKQNKNPKISWRKKRFCRCSYFVALRLNVTDVIRHVIRWLARIWVCFTESCKTIPLLDEAKNFYWNVFHTSQKFNLISFYAIAWGCYELSVLTSQFACERARACAFASLQLIYVIWKLRGAVVSKYLCFSWHVLQFFHIFFSSCSFASLFSCLSISLQAFARSCVCGLV